MFHFIVHCCFVLIFAHSSFFKAISNNKSTTYLKKFTNVTILNLKTELQCLYVHENIGMISLWNILNGTYYAPDIVGLKGSLDEKW